MNESTSYKILLATDFSDSAQLAQLYTEYLAVTLKASVVVLHVSEHPSPAERTPTEGQIQTSLRALKDKIGERAVPVSVQRSMGNAGDHILFEAHRLNADVIAMGTQGYTHVPYGLIGATARIVTTNGPCPVLTVPFPGKEASPCVFTAPEKVEIRRLLAPVDFSDPSLDSLECAVHFAHRLGADLVLLHVVEPAHADWDVHRMHDAAQMRDQWEARLGHLAGVMKSLGVCATYEVRTGTPPDSIVAGALQHQCDLIVMGTHGRRGRERMDVGSVAEAVLRQAPCPVLTVKNPKVARGMRPAIEHVLSKNPTNAMTNPVGLNTTKSEGGGDGR